MSRNEKDNFVATKAEKTFDDDGNIQVAKVIKIDDKLLLKKLEDTGGNIRKSKLLNGTASLSSVLSYEKIDKNIEEISKILSVKNVMYYIIEKKGAKMENLTFSDRKLYGPIDNNYYAISINVFDSKKNKKIYTSNIYTNIGDNITSWTSDDEYFSNFNRLNQGILYAPQKYHIDIKRQEMKAASDSLYFERAIILRDEINKLENNANKLLQIIIEK